MNYTFTQEQAEQAYEAWGCNCGPTALAFALQTGLDDVHPHIPDFDLKRYTSPSMMKRALINLDRVMVECPPSIEAAFHEWPALVRVQWHGPWTAPGANPKWAYRQTHWICTWLETGPYVFDCNGGITNYFNWVLTIVPFITKHIPRADGRWSFTHVWRIPPSQEALINRFVERFNSASPEQLAKAVQP